MVGRARYAGWWRECQSLSYRFLHNVTVTGSQSQSHHSPTSPQDDSMRRGLLLTLLRLIPPALIILAILSVSHRADLSVHLAGSVRALKISRSLVSRTPWQQDDDCRQFNISYLEPGSGDILPLASYPGSGSTWVRSALIRARERER